MNTPIRDIGWPIKIGCGKPKGKARNGCVFVDAKTGYLWKWKRGKWIRDLRFD